MICENCGTKLPNNSKFCGTCGFYLGDWTEGTQCQENEKQKEQKKRLRDRLFAGAIAFPIYLLLVCLAGAFVVGTVYAITTLNDDDLHKLKAKVSNRDYEDIYEIAKQANASGSEMLPSIECAISDIYQKYENNEISYEQAMSELDTLKSLEILRNGKQKISENSTLSEMISRTKELIDLKNELNTDEIG